jgi:hypothetical protein
LAKKGVSPDCSDCHSVKTFSPSSYSIEKHNRSGFALDGSHMATPCFACHKTDEKWNFAITKTRCIDCHENFHKDYIDEKYMPEADCKSCHSNKMWDEILFDHNKTNFQLLGKHKNASCRNCHFEESAGNLCTQQFKGLATSCENCHVDVHFKQFVQENRTDCTRCHTFNNWKAEKFNHSNTRFKLDGEHLGLECIKCHKPSDRLIQDYVVYKLEDTSCKSCH